MLISSIINFSMLTDIVRFALGDQHSMILKQDGSVWSTSVALRGSHLPLRGSPHSFSKQFVNAIPSNAIAMAAGTAFSMVLRNDGSLWATGRNSKGQLGDGTQTSKDTFVFVTTIDGAKDVATGGYHSIVLTEEGRVWVTGWNKYGQLGDGLMTTHATRFFAVTSNWVKAIAAGDIHSIVMKHDGSVWATGRNNNGQLGDGSNDDRSNFVQVITDGAAEVTAGGYRLQL